MARRRVAGKKVLSHLRTHSPMRRSFEIERLLDAARSRAGAWVLLEQCPSARASRDFAARLRKRNNGEGRWEFAARFEDTQRTRRYLVYGKVEFDG